MISMVNRVMSSFAGNGVLWITSKYWCGRKLAAKDEASDLGEFFDPEVLPSPHSSFCGS